MIGVFQLYHRVEIAWSPGPLGGSWRSSKLREAATREGVMGGGAKSGSKERGPGERALHQLELRNVVGVANICYCFLCGYACVRAYTVNGGEIQCP